ncbi:hypothetical protein BJ742DRAFT_737380 [Cladochytrium replicatum]|nr:hypothetical protein BJ742DRAFT_737380 [Cladochytrium replicatum]
MTESEEQIFYLSLAFFNMFLQVGLFYCFYRGAYNALTDGKRSMNLVLKMEIIVCVISLASIVFWAGRLIPIWDDFSCSIFHGAIMALIELRSSCYTYVQIFRFMVALGYNKLYMDTFTVIVTLVSMGLGAAFQRGIAEGRTCDFQHSHYSLGTATFRILVEIEILKRDSLARSDDRVQFVMRVLAILLIICAVWMFAFSVINIMLGYTILRVIISNFHFSVILFCVGLPRWMIRLRTSNSSRSEEGKILRDSTGKYSDSRRRLSAINTFEKAARTSRPQTDIERSAVLVEENIDVVEVGSHIRPTLTPQNVENKCSDSMMGFGKRNHDPTKPKALSPLDCWTITYLVPVSNSNEIRAFTAIAVHARTTVYQSKDVELPAVGRVHKQHTRTLLRRLVISGGVEAVPHQQASSLMRRLAMSVGVENVPDQHISSSSRRHVDYAIDRKLARIPLAWESQLALKRWMLKTALHYKRDPVDCLEDVYFKLETQHRLLDDARSHTQQLQFSNDYHFNQVVSKELAIANQQIELFHQQETNAILQATNERLSHRHSLAERDAAFYRDGRDMLREQCERYFQENGQLRSMLSQAEYKLEDAERAIQNACYVNEELQKRVQFLESEQHKTRMETMQKESVARAREEELMKTIETMESESRAHEENGRNSIETSEAEMKDLRAELQDSWGTRGLDLTENTMKIQTLTKERNALQYSAKNLKDKLDLTEERELEEERETMKAEIDNLWETVHSRHEQIAELTKQKHRIKEKVEKKCCSIEKSMLEAEERHKGELAKLESVFHELKETRLDSTKTCTDEQPISALISLPIQPPWSSLFINEEDYARFLSEVPRPKKQKEFSRLITNEEYFHDDGQGKACCNLCRESFASHPKNSKPLVQHLLSKTHQRKVIEAINSVPGAQNLFRFAFQELPSGSFSGFLYTFQTTWKAK